MPIVIDELLGRTGSVLQAQGYVLATVLAAATIALVVVVELTADLSFGRSPSSQDRA